MAGVCSEGVHQRVELLDCELVQQPVDLAHNLLLRTAAVIPSSIRMLDFPQAMAGRVTSARLVVVADRRGPWLPGILGLAAELHLLLAP